MRNAVREGGVRACEQLNVHNHSNPTTFMDSPICDSVSPRKRNNEPCSKINVWLGWQALSRSTQASRQISLEAHSCFSSLPDLSPELASIDTIELIVIQSDQSYLRE